MHNLARRIHKESEARDLLEIVDADTRKHQQFSVPNLILPVGT